MRCALCKIHTVTEIKPLLLDVSYIHFFYLVNGTETQVWLLTIIVNSTADAYIHGSDVLASSVVDVDAGADVVGAGVVVVVSRLVISNSVVSGIVIA